MTVVAVAVAAAVAVADFGVGHTRNPQTLEAVGGKEYSAGSGDYLAWAKDLGAREGRGKSCRADAIVERLFGGPMTEKGKWRANEEAASPAGKSGVDIACYQLEDRLGMIHSGVKAQDCRRSRAVGYSELSEAVDHVDTYKQSCAMIAVAGYEMEE